MKTFETLVVAALLVLLGIVVVQNASGSAQVINSGGSAFANIFSSLRGGGTIGAFGGQIAA